jgi:protein-L-isoaspartate O-methyltransferase
MAAYTFRLRPLRLALGIGAFLAVSLLGGDNKTLFRERSFFGVARVEADEARGLVTLVHGTTLHGARLTDPEHVLEPITYYSAAGPVGDVFNFARAPARIAVVGLGTGTLACWTRPGDTLTFYEIDPAIVRIARDTRYFSFLAGCAPEAPIVLGDARLELAKAADAAYDRIVVDAFSSDAIPVHLLTREAVALYFRKLAPGGILIVHISNRNLDLAPIVAALGRDAGLVAMRRDDQSTAEGAHSLRRTRSDFIALARSPEALAFLARRPGWHALDAAHAGRPWSDDYSDIVGALRWGKSESE